MNTSLFVLEMLVLGAGVGLISGSLGLGGGVIMVPVFLTFVPGMDPHTAKGTSLFAIVFVSAINAWRLTVGHADKQGSVALVLALGSTAGGYLGAWATAPLSDSTVVWIFVCILVLLGLRTFLLEPKPVAPDQVRRRTAIALLIGLATGAVSGLSGVGGGMVLVPLALLAGIASNERVVALANMVMVPTCVASVTVHFLTPQTFMHVGTVGQVNMLLAALVLLGAQAGSPLGRRLNAHLTLPRRRLVMAILLLGIAIRLVYYTLR